MVDYLTIQEVSQLLNISPSTIYHNGPGGYGGVKIGGVWRFPADKVGTAPEPKTKTKTQKSGGYIRRFGRNKGQVV